MSVLYFLSWYLCIGHSWWDQKRLEMLKCGGNYIFLIDWFYCLLRIQSQKLAVRKYPTQEKNKQCNFNNFRANDISNKAYKETNQRIILFLIFAIFFFFWFFFSIIFFFYIKSYRNEYRPLKEHRRNKTRRR